MRTLFLLALLVPLQASTPAPMSFVRSPMKVFVEIDGVLYEVMISRKPSEIKERADEKIHDFFRGEATKYGEAYLRKRIVLRKK